MASPQGPGVPKKFLGRCIGHASQREVRTPPTLHHFTLPNNNNNNNNNKVTYKQRSLLKTQTRCGNMSFSAKGKGEASSLDIAPLTILNSGTSQPRKWQLTGNDCSIPRRTQ